MSRLIQFFHPGGESKPDQGQFYRSWNKSGHTRTFLTAPGVCVSSPDSKSPEQAQLVFWGEWEGPATVRPISTSRVAGMPQNLFIPHSDRYARPLDPNEICYNTDPFVFGPEFVYCWCKQEWAKSLRKLERGDIILFGSRLDSQFVLDTVFVVASYIDYAAPAQLLHYNLAQQLISFPLEFVEASIRPIVGKPASPGENYRLYRGATFDNPVNGMFSYAPAIPASSAPLGFARPALDPPLNFIGNEQNQGIKNIDEDDGYFETAQATGFSVFESWQQVTNSVCSQGLRLGVRFQLPGALLYFSHT